MVYVIVGKNSAKEILPNTSIKIQSTITTISDLLKHSHKASLKAEAAAVRNSLFLNCVQCFSQATQHRNTMQLVNCIWTELLLKQSTDSQDFKWNNSENSKIQLQEKIER